MKYRKIFSFFLVFSIVNGIALFGMQKMDKIVTKRYAMVVGANNGGKDRIKLKYAESDAKSMLKVLEHLGGVESGDNVFLAQPDRDKFFMEMGRLKEKIDKSRSDYRRVELIFYYSGHSDEDCILLSNNKISYEALRDAISSMSADVRIAILDSCASGAFTREKGGRKKLPFLMDTAYNMKGYAVMTSSSSTEASQESDLIKGSFFTHYLISGMRGAADMSQDGRVTLSEAYQFAFNETLTETTKTVSGPQHPHYNIQMAGTGDVIMTDIREGSAILVLDKSISGKIFIHDKNDFLVVELTKPFGRQIELGLEEGEYHIINIPEGEVFESKIKLERGEDFKLYRDEFRKTDIQYTTPRGDRSVRVRKETILRGKSSLHLFAEFGSKSTTICGEYALLMGMNFGLTFNRVFSVGFGGYGKANFDPGLPGYGGIFFAYTFYPEKKVHLRATAIAGGGVGISEDIFFIFEPGIEMVVNLSRVVRIYAGVSKPFVDKKYSDLKNPIFCVGFQFGK